MAIEFLKEKWVGSVNVVTIGATKEEGGSRKQVVHIGGQKTLPYLFNEGEIPYPPTIAFEVWDTEPLDWPDALVKPFKDVLSSPAAWASKVVEEYNAELICLKFMGAHPENQNRSADDVAKTLESILKAVDVPLIVLGCGDDAKDNLILPKCSEVSKGERILFGNAVQDNYKTLVASCLADGHNIFAESPIDINIAKQLNILISDMGLPLERIVINPTIGALGYGLEYAYSIMERARLAALAGDKTLACPFICFVAQESWRAKEAKASNLEFPSWGAESERGIIWETITATALIQAGADILVMRHPKAIEKIRNYIDNLWLNKS